MRLRKKLAIVGAGVLTLGITGSAFAYWTASGTGTGTADVGTDNGVSIAVDIPDALYPGGSVDVDLEVTNNSADAPVKIDKIVASDITVDAVGCDAADFSFADVTADYELDPSEVKHFTGELVMDDTAVNQDACKNAEVTLDVETDNSAID